EVCRECDGTGWFVTPEQARAALAQPSPAQAEAEAERPEVVAYRTIGRNEKHQHPHYALNYYKQNAEDQAAHWRERGCEVSEDELMTVAQHDRIFGALRADRDSWAEQAEQRLADWESARGRLDSAAAERDAALARFDGAVLGALREVERALALYAGERQRRADLQRALDEQRHAYRLARSNYRAGALDALELLDSQRSLVADRARLVDAEMRVAERQVELFRALGGGWQAAPSPSHQENGQ
ncbi:TolC family protein, partial [Pseudomonas aeruginosa]|uniref:TolC family protein n=1 Tax=Pseudomonas aeruginosa TaxID=287 RepID=UPI001D0AFAB3